MHSKHSVTVRVPATSANLGPGFDCLGIALALYHTVTLTPQDKPGVTITAVGEDAHKIPLDASNLVWTAAQMIFEQVGDRHQPLGLHIRQENAIPIGSGLGSSSAAVLAGMLGANILLHQPLSREEILQVAAHLEGHPDNVAPALHGGLILGLHTPQGFHIEPIAVPPLQVVVVLPDVTLPTAEARAALPRQVPLQDASFNAGRMGLLVRALETADYTKLRTAMQDRLHQPYRLPLIPGMQAAFEAAYAAGAAGVALSGAGPGLIAFAANRHAEIAAATARAFADGAGLSSRRWILSVDHSGAQHSTTATTDNP